MGLLPFGSDHWRYSPLQGQSVSLEHWAVNVVNFGGKFYTRSTYAHLVRIKALLGQGCSAYHIYFSKGFLQCCGGLAFGGLETACRGVATTHASAAASVKVIRGKNAYCSETPSGRLAEVAASTERLQFPER